jgi:hypothetical protein
MAGLVRPSAQHRCKNQSAGRPRACSRMLLAGGRSMRRNPWVAATSPAMTPAGLVRETRALPRIPRCQRTTRQAPKMHPASGASLSKTFLFKRPSEHWRGRKAPLRHPSRLVEFETDSVYPVGRDAHAAGVRLRQFQNQEHRSCYAKGTKRRHGDGRAAGF